MLWTAPPYAFANAAFSSRRGDRIERLACCDCSQPLVAQSGSSRRRINSVGVGGEADISRCVRATVSPQDH